MTVPRFVAVVLPVPVSRPYIYEVPSELAARVVPGARVLVPLRRTRVIGIVTEAVSRLPSAGVDIKPIAAAPDDDPALSPALLELGRWLSDYYGAPLGLSLRALLPGPLWSVARPAGPAPTAERLLACQGRDLSTQESNLGYMPVSGRVFSCCGSISYVRTPPWRGTRPSL